MEDKSVDMPAYIADLGRRNWSKGFINYVVPFALDILNDDTLNREERLEKVLIYLAKQGARYDEVMGLGRQQ